MLSRKRLETIRKVFKTAISIQCCNTQPAESVGATVGAAREPPPYARFNGMPAFDVIGRLASRPYEPRLRTAIHFKL